MVRRQFATSPDNPVHHVHPADVAMAAVNALNNPEALGRIFLIGGGAGRRITQYEFLAAPLAALGVKLPREFLGKEQYYTHWMDTAESERVLHFQQHSFDDFRAELKKTIGRWRPLAAPFAPLVLWGLRRSLRNVAINKDEEAPIFQVADTASSQTSMPPCRNSTTNSPEPPCGGCRKPPPLVLVQRPTTR